MSHNYKFKTGKGAAKDESTGIQLIDFSASVSLEIAKRLHSLWTQGKI